MKVILEQEEIELALRQYMHNTLGIPKDKNIVIEFKAGRGANGLEATLDITSGGANPAVTTPRGYIAAPATTSVVVEDDQPAAGIPQAVKENEATDDAPEEETKTSGAQALLEDVGASEVPKKSLFGR